MPGSRALCIAPQSSTIANHLPKAVGAAWSIGAAKRHRPGYAILSDNGLIFYSFGDAPVNYSTTQGPLTPPPARRISRCLCRCFFVATITGSGFPTLHLRAGSRRISPGDRGGDISPATDWRSLTDSPPARPPPLPSGAVENRLPAYLGAAPLWPCRGGYTDDLTAESRRRGCDFAFFPEGTGQQSDSSQDRGPGRCRAALICWWSMKPAPLAG